MSRRFEEPTVRECNAVMKEFEARAVNMSEEIVRLRKNQMPEEVPKIKTVYAIPLNCKHRPGAMHYHLQMEKPEDAEHITLYQPLD